MTLQASNSYLNNAPVSPVIFPRAVPLQPPLRRLTTIHDAINPVQITGHIRVDPGYPWRPAADSRRHDTHQSRPPLCEDRHRAARVALTGVLLLAPGTEQVRRDAGREAASEALLFRVYLVTTRLGPDGQVAAQQDVADVAACPQKRGGVCWWECYWRV